MTKSKIYLSFITFLFMINVLSAQIHVDANGSVGIGTDDTTFDTIYKTKLKLTSDGMDNNIDKNRYLSFIYTGAKKSLNNYGIYSEMINNPGYGYGGVFLGGRVGIQAQVGDDNIGGTYKYGVIGYSKNGTTRNIGTYTYGLGSLDFTYNYGVHARGLGVGAISYGVYASASGASTNYAGYFDGNVVITGTISTSSDEKLKEDYGVIEGSIEKLKKLKPKSYSYKQDQKIKLAKGKHFGFTAQEMEKIFPEIVSSVQHNILVDPDLEENENQALTDEVITYKAINYIELIPILTQAIQDQQLIIEDLQKRIKALEQK